MSLITLTMILKPERVRERIVFVLNLELGYALQVARGKTAHIRTTGSGEDVELRHYCLRIGWLRCFQHPSLLNEGTFRC